MPYPGIPESEWGTLDTCVEKVMSKGHDKSSAIAICRNSMNLGAEFISEKYGFEPFGSLAGVLRGEPVKIMPLGTFYRDERKLEITEADLREIERNFKANLPRFRIPVNENHQPTGKIGNVKDVAYKPDGTDGAGLYASLDLTDEGKALLKAGRYDAVSPEMVWQKAGATYQDPQTNKRYSNVLVGLAVTDRPYFSHEHVALFSATPPMTDNYRDFTAEQRRQMAESGEALPDGSYPIANKGDLQNAIHAVGRGGTSHAKIRAHIVKRAKALGVTDMLPPDWMSMDSTAESFQHEGHMGKNGPHAGHESKGGGGGGGGEGSEGGSAAREKAHSDFKFLQRRLNAGGLKRGEKATIEKRMEALAKVVLGVPENSSAGIQAETFMVMTPELKAMCDSKMKGMTPDERARHEADMKDMSPAECLMMLEDMAAYLDVEHMTGPTYQESHTDRPMNAKRHNGYTKLREIMKAKFDELMAMVKDEDDDGEPDMPMDSPEMKPKHEGMSVTVPVAGDANKPAADAAVEKGLETMADGKDKPEVFTVPAEEFAALRAKAEKVEQLQKQAETFAAELAQTKRARRLDQITDRVDKFMAIGADRATLADNLLKLEEVAPALFAYFDGLLGALDGELVQADLFTQRSSARTGGAAETFEDLAAKLHADKFDAAPEKYKDALSLAAKQAPALYAEYVSRVSGGKGR